MVAAVKSLVPALSLLLVFAVAGCRGDDPDEAPPIGAVPAASAAEVAPIASAADVTIASNATSSRATTAPETAAIDPAARFRVLSAAAEAQLDAAWRDCGNGTSDADARCRDEAVFAYDAALDAARATLGEAAAAAAMIPVPGTLPTPTGAELAVAQVTGTRG